MDNKPVPEKRPKFNIPREVLIPMVERMQRREPGSMEEMRSACTDYLKRYFGAKLPANDKQTQRDFLEDTLVIAYININDLKTPDAFVSWLRTIARSKIYHYYKDREIKQRREEKEIERQKRELIRSYSRPSEFNPKDPELYEKIDKLPPKQREAILLQLKGFKVKEIAERQGVSVGTVKSRLNYARIKIRQQGHEL